MKCKLIVSLTLPLFIASMAFSQSLLFTDEPYLSFDDSPFAGMSGVVLEDFEDGVFNMAGVTAVSNTPGTIMSVYNNTTFTDSIDGDDGSVNGTGHGNGQTGHSFAESSNSSSDDLGYTFTFDATAFCDSLPTHVGIVWTDGSFSAPTQVEFFGAGGVSLGVLGPFHISDNTFADSPNEDRFFGAIHDEGIESFTIRSPGGSNNLEVDHLQFVVENILIGDMNCDGTVNLLDVHPFIDILSSGLYDLKADINQDGGVNLLDIDPFIALVAGG